MSVKEEPLESMKRELTIIKRMIVDTPGEYVSGKHLMVQASEQLERSPRGALKTILKAREMVEAEGRSIRRYDAIGSKKSSIPSYQKTEDEIHLDSEFLSSLHDGDFEKAETVLKKLEDALHEDVVDNVDSGIVLDLPDGEISQGKGNTMNALIKNLSGFPIRIFSMTGRSAQAQVIVFEEYKGAMQPGSERNIRINVISGIEGDLVVELEAVVEINSKRVNIMKHASMRVTAPTVQVGNTIPRPASTMQYQPVAAMDLPGPASAQGAGQMSYDPMVLVDKGTVDQWVDCLNMYYQSKSAISLGGVTQAYQEYQRREGYSNLFQAILSMEYAKVPEWSVWFDSKGFSGDDLTRRCTGLLFEMRTSSNSQSEFELDGSVGSSNSDHMVGALNIASGNIVLPREKLRGIKAWDIKVSRSGKESSFHVDRSVVKGTEGSNSKAIFKLSR